MVVDGGCLEIPHLLYNYVMCVICRDGSVGLPSVYEPSYEATQYINAFCTK